MLEMTRKIIQGTYTDYIFLFHEHRTGFSDYAARNASASGGSILILMEDDSPCGYLCTVSEQPGTRIIFASTNEKKRRMGVFSELIKYAAENLPRPIRLNISSEHKFYETAVHICKAAGFEFQSSCNVFRGNDHDFIRWEEYMSDMGGKLCSALERQGYSCVSFADADNSLIDEIYHSGENSFGNRLDVKVFFDNPQKNMNRDMSFATVKDGSLTAYTLVSCPDSTSAVFEHISAGEKYIGSGCILLSFAGSMESFKRFGCRRAAYAMYDENGRANAFRRKLLQKVTSTSARSENYILK